MEGWAIALIIIAFFILVLASINFLDKKIQQKKKAAALRLIAHSKRADRDRLISEIHYPINSLSENEIQLRNHFEIQPQHFILAKLDIFPLYNFPKLWQHFQMSKLK